MGRKSKLDPGSVRQRTFPPQKSQNCKKSIISFAICFLTQTFELTLIFHTPLGGGIRPLNISLKDQGRIVGGRRWYPDGRSSCETCLWKDNATKGCFGVGCGLSTHQTPFDA